MTRKVFFTTGADGRMVARAADPDSDPEDAAPGADLSAVLVAEYRSGCGARPRLSRGLLK